MDQCTLSTIGHESITLEGDGVMVKLLVYFHESLASETQANRRDRVAIEVLSDLAAEFGRETGEGFANC
jgi:hypothetical protein